MAFSDYENSSDPCVAKANALKNAFTGIVIPSNGWQIEVLELPFHTSLEDIQMIFTKYGVIDKLAIVYKLKENSMNCYLSFEKEIDSLEAIKENGKKVGPNLISVHKYNSKVEKGNKRMRAEDNGWTATTTSSDKSEWGSTAATSIGNNGSDCGPSTSISIGLNCAEVYNKGSKAQAEGGRRKRKLKFDSNKEIPNTTSISDKIKYAVNLLKDDFFCFEVMREQIKGVTNKISTLKGVMNDLQTKIERNNHSKESETVEDREQLDILGPLRCSIGSINSRRFSTSSQDRDLKRRLSYEKLNRDFKILTDLSTILELSREHRLSSIGFVGESSSGSETTTTIANLVDTLSAGTSAGTSNTSIRRSISLTTTTNKTKSTGTKKNNKKAKTKSKKENNKKIENQTNDEVNKQNNSIISVYDFTEEEERNRAQIKCKRNSERIRSKSKN